MVATPANAADSTVLPDLLHGKETRVWGDQAYRGQRAVIRQHAPRAQDFTNRRYRHRGVVDEVERAKNRTKSTVRAIWRAGIYCAANRRNLSLALPSAVVDDADLTPNNANTRSYTVTGCRNFTGRYLFTTPCSDLP